MKRYLWMMLILCTVATPAFAVQIVYLKDGGTIRAKSVWRSHGRVYVLATRDTVTDFSTAEIDLKRTFVRKHRIVKKRKPLQATQESATTAPSEPNTAESKAKLSLPGLPKLPESKPENLVPSSGAGGTIKQHKKEMAERAGE